MVLKARWPSSPDLRGCGLEGWISVWHATASLFSSGFEWAMGRVSGEGPPCIRGAVGVWHQG